MKKLLYFSIIATGLVLASCAKDDKDDPQAPSPSTDARDPYIAYWNVSEDEVPPSGAPNTFTSNIVKSTTNSGEVIIHNFSGLSESVRASVSGNYLTIPYQQIGSIGFAKGSGTLSANTSSINMAYTTTVSTNQYTYTALYTK